MTDVIQRTYERVPIQRFSLAVTDGPDAPTKAVSRDQSVVIGTHASCTFRLSDPGVSRFHCELRVEDEGRVRLVDLGSRNGTRVNGVWVEHAWLDRDATLRVGRDVIRFRLETTPNALTISPLRSFGELVGSSAAMRRVFELLARVAPSSTTVLLSGETGTGKELAARAIHDHSDRAERPYVVVDCGALPSELIQSELFGHVRGAFTGAHSDRAGAFEAADGGTVFLDEIGELPLELQPQLLRVLERKQVRRVGANEQIDIDVRIVAATHRDLRRAINRKRFRSDLYFRLAVMEVELPPLRERAGDLPELVAVLCERAGINEADRARLQTPAFLESLAAEEWPGNVRELRNHIERACLLGVPVEASGDIDSTFTFADTDRPLKALVAELERAYLARVLDETDGNVSETAKRSGVSRMQVYRLIHKYGLRSE